MNTLIKMVKRPKIQIILLIAFLAIWSMFDGIVQSKILLLVYAVAVTVCAEWMIWGRIKSSMLQSAIITGLIIGVLAAPSGNHLFAWCAGVAGIAAKRILHFRGKGHTFNPAAFGLIIGGIVFSNQVNWWGNSSSMIIIIVGGYILFRLNRLSMPFAYVILRTLSAIAMGNNFSTAIMLPNLFFAFVMLVEPKTSPSKRIEQWLFGGTCGFLSTLFYVFFASFEGDLLALLVVNTMRPLFSKLIQIVSTKRIGGTHEIK